MKVLLVNNHTKHLKFLNSALASHDLEIVMYKPGVHMNYEDKDLIVLSGGGGEGLEIDDRVSSGTYWYQDQMELVMRSPKPILGICMGFEVISRAYGSKVEEMKSLITGFKNVTTTSAGREQINKPSLRQFEAHKWRVGEINGNYFDVLADSDTGIEIIKHKRRPIIATQFHPEKGGTLQIPQLLAMIS